MIGFTRKEFALFLLLRLLGLFFNSWFVPDEYWQSIEVAHNWVFGYGYLTWEWKEQIRSILFPGMFAVQYKILQIFNIDTVFLLTQLPRVFSACISTLTDCTALMLSNKLYGPKSRYCVILCLCSNWFLEYCSCRTLSAVPETLLTTFALYLFPWHKLTVSTSCQYLLAAGLGTALRPTTVTPFLPLFSLHLMRLRGVNRKAILLFKATVATLSISIALLLTDSVYYQRLTFVPYNFFHFNVYSGLSSHYGTQPLYWYLTEGLPSVLGPHFLVLCLALMKKGYHRDMRLIGPTLFTIFVYSCVPHKELRLLLPLLPSLLIVCGVYLHTHWTTHSTSSRYSLPRKLVVLLLVVPSALMAILFGLVHQRGPIALMGTLSSMVTHHGAANVLFLMPCHSTPLYSHLHINISTRFLTCEPNLKHIEGYTDEADRFYEDPNAWLEAHLPTKRPVRPYSYDILNPLPSLPTHIVIFDVLQQEIHNFFVSHEYKECVDVFHSLFNDGKRGKRLKIFCLNVR